MFRTTFVAITGSAGKTTTAACVGTILSAHFPTHWTPGGHNGRLNLARDILRTRFRHRFMVIEVGTRTPGSLRKAAWMIAPDIAVVLTVLGVHTDAFPALEAMAAEKEQLLSRLGRRGLAILNADDPLVRDMATRCRGSVRMFGAASADAFIGATDVSAIWPRRLSFWAHHGADCCRVQTNLVGEHMLTPALAALAVAVSCGIPLEQAAAEFAHVQPVAGRMQPMTLPCGAVVLRDDFNESLPALVAGLDVMRTAEAARRIVIVGDVLDSTFTVRPRLRDLGQRVGGSADLAIFIGYASKISVKAAIAAGLSPECARSFQNLREAAAFLQQELRPGDLVFVHGWTAHQIERVILAQLGTISCWIERCTRMIDCDRCPELKLIPLLPAGAPTVR
ncbi:MAG: Mur ligase family protein [Bryobacteraceae bacterium]|jgi:UDP-N-acetylmuramoyl-tripeptide--D-alanyl-D-alanine ligase